MPCLSKQSVGVGEVVQGEEPMPEQLLRAVEVSEVGARVSTAGNAFAVGLDRRRIVVPLSPPDRQVARPREGLAVSGQAGREDAVEQVDAAFDGVEHALRVAEAHDIAHRIGG